MTTREKIWCVIALGSLIGMIAFMEIKSRLSTASVMMLYEMTSPYRIRDIPLEKVYSESQLNSLRRIDDILGTDWTKEEK